MLIEVWTNALADKKFKAKFAIKRNRSSEWFYAAFWKDIHMYTYM
jgi:hypothetical protein